MISDLVALFVRPSALFGEFHRTRRTGPALVLLVFLHLLYAGALLSTGVPDYEIQAQAQKMINREAEKLKGDEDSDELTRTVEALEKMASFNQVFSRIALLAGGPVRLLVGIAVVSSVLFLLVSLGGIAKADFAQIAAVVVFASYTEVPRLLVKLYLISQLHVLRVETSLAALLSHPQVAPALFLLLRRFDPFEFWYWGLIGLGLWKTGQLSGRRAVLVALVLALGVGLLQGCLGAGDLVETEGLIKIGDKE